MYETKNKRWFLDFESKAFDEFFYAESNAGVDGAIKNTYFDLLVLRQGEKFNALPAPIFLSKYWPDTKEFPNDDVRPMIFDYLDENEVEYSIISREEYREMMDDN